MAKRNLPKTLQPLTEELKTFIALRTELNIAIGNAGTVYATREDLRQQASDEGYPGDPTEFNKAAFGIMDVTAKLRAMADRLESVSQGMLFKGVDEW